MKKYAIVGSRTFTDYNLFKTIVDKFKHKISEIVSGGARGVDSLAERYAKENRIKITVFKPDWKKHRMFAGFARNIKIVENVDIVFAFWNMKSRGTKNTITQSKRLNKLVIIYNYENK